MKAIPTLLVSALLALGVQAHAADVPATGTGSGAASSQPINDRSFAAAAAQNGLAEIEMAQLAQQKASDPEVKQFAEELMAAHSSANDQLKQIAQDQGIKLPTRLSKDDQKVKNELSQLSGSQFDQRFVQAQVKDHQKAIDLFQREVNSGQSEPLRDYAQQTLPHLQAHLKTAQQLSAQMGSSSR